MQEHKKGEHVIRLLHAEHAQFGSISYELRRLWQLHYRMARSGYIELCRHHNRVLRLPLQPSNDRLITADERPDLSLMVYAAGTQMAINTVLTMQHFCQEIEACVGIELQESAIGARIKEAFELAQFSATWQDAGYVALREIIERRRAIEHPKRENTTISHPNDWDLVPLSWFLTERAPKAFKLWDSWFAQIIEEWKRHPVNQPKTLTLTVERGKKSARQAKKPPRE